MTVLPGIDVLLERKLEMVAGQRLGLVASPSSVDRHLNSSIERLQQNPAVRLVALFGPEHGVRGSAQAGDHVSDFVDPITQLPVYSLYGDTKSPTDEMLAGIDMLVYDLQDGGVRFYTYLSTLIYILQAGARHQTPVVVLDRPNPISGRKPEGPILDPAYTSFVGMAPVPIRHAMTAGELALMCNDVLAIGCNLMVVTMDGWRRSMWFDDTGLPFVQPSPNLPTLTSLTVYPGTCLVEGTTLSEGRGTTRPFEVIGAPWLDGERLARDLNAQKLPGVHFRPVYFTPQFSKHSGQLCSGVQLHILDRERFPAVETALHLLTRAKANHPEDFAWRLAWSDGGQRPIDLLSGGSQIREHLDAGNPVSELIGSWQEALVAYERHRAPYLLYQD
jgi:beta-N-acetylhexosaminidase